MLNTTLKRESDAGNPIFGIAVRSARAAACLGAALGLSLTGAAATYTFDVSADRAATADEIAAVEALGAGDTVLKTGTGKLTYTGAFAFAGTLQIDAGTFAVQSSGVVTNKMTLTGTGTFRQESGERVVEATHDLTPNSADFTGDYVIAGGTNTLMAKNADISAKYGATSGKLVVDGGTLRTCASLPDVKGTSDYSLMTFAAKPIHLKGTGADGKGALLSDYYFNVLLKVVVLDGDTTISAWKGPRNYTSQYITFGYDSKASATCTMDFQGYDLTVLDVPSTAINSYSRLSDNGRLIVKSVNVSQPSLYVYGNVNLGTPDGDGALVFEGQNANLYDFRVGSFTRPIEIDLTGQLHVAPIYAGTNTYFKAPIVFKESNLGYLHFDKVSKELPGDNVIVDAPVTGPGRIVYSYSAVPYRQYESMTFNSRTNTLSGGIAMTDGKLGERLVFTYPDVVPDYSKIAATNGAVIVNGANWGSSNVLALAREARIKNAVEYAQNAVFVNTADCADQTATIAVTDEDLADGMVPIGHDGSGTLVVSANAPTKPLALRMGGGAIKLTGEHLVLSNAVWSQTLGTNNYLHADRARESSVSFENISDVALSDLVFGELPDAWPGREDPLVLRVKNATLHDDRAATKSAPALSLGHKAANVLQVEDGAQIDSTMTVGYQYGSGAVYQRGGDVYWRDGNAWATRAWLGYSTASCGYYELAGGTLTNNSVTTVGAGGANTCGIIVQTGGRFDGYQVNLGSNHALGLYDMKGGTANIRGPLTFVRADAGNSATDATLIQEGGEMTVNNGLTLCGGSTNNLVLMTLTGGRFSTAYNVGKSNVATWDKGVWRRPEWNRAYMNFNGGTFHWTGSGDVFVTNDLRAVDRITVFAKGAAIEVDANKTVRLNQAFQAPEAGKLGVASVPWTGDFTKNVFVGPPAVQILGDGVGATAVARFDSTTRTVTGIDVVAPGSGYTWAKAVLSYGRSSSSSPWRVQTNDCVMTAAAPVSGDLVKKGAGTLQLTVPNTYGGDTVVEEGTLYIGCEGAVPDGSCLVMKGGSVTAASGVAIPPMHFDLKVGETLAFGNPVAVSANSTLSITGEPVKEGSPYVLATFTSLTNAENLQLTSELPPNWSVSVTSTKIRLAFKTGTVLIFR